MSAVEDLIAQLNREVVAFEYTAEKNEMAMVSGEDARALAGLMRKTVSRLAEARVPEDYGLAREQRETLAAWMTARGYATGPGETLSDLLAELGCALDEHAAADASRLEEAEARAAKLEEEREGVEQWSALTPPIDTIALTARARKRADWWREMHGPNDLDEEIYDELADAIVALSAKNETLAYKLGRADASRIAELEAENRVLVGKLNAHEEADARRYDQDDLYD